MLYTSRTPIRIASMRSRKVGVVGRAVFALLGIAAAEEYKPPLRTSEGFGVPQPGHRFEFPRDHGSHPDFAIEWWYLTGQLYGEQNRCFGFQATFFRRTGPL